MENDAKNIKYFFILLKWLPDIKQWLECTSFEKKKNTPRQFSSNSYHKRKNISSSTTLSKHIWSSNLF